MYAKQKKKEQQRAFHSKALSISRRYSPHSRTLVTCKAIAGNFLNLRLNVGVFSNRYKSLAVNRMKDFKNGTLPVNSEILSLQGNQMK